MYTRSPRCSPRATKVPLKRTHSFVSRPVGKKIAHLGNCLSTLAELFTRTPGNPTRRRHAKRARLAFLLPSHAHGRDPQVHALLALMSLHPSRDWARSPGTSPGDRLKRGLEYLELASAGPATPLHLAAGIAACRALPRRRRGGRGKKSWPITIHSSYPIIPRSQPYTAPRLFSVCSAPQQQSSRLTENRLHPPCRLFPYPQNPCCLPPTRGIVCKAGRCFARARACYREALERAGRPDFRRLLIRKLNTTGL